MNTRRNPHDSRPIAPIAATDLDRLIDTLMVRFVWLSECLVGEGYRLDMSGQHDAPGIHYNLVGAGQLVVGEGAPIELTPHTLIVVPANSPFRIEVPSPRHPRAALKVVDGRAQIRPRDAVHRYVATDGPACVVLICGYFHASYGSSIDLFGGLAAPIVERFDERDGVDTKLRAALAELVAHEVGYGAMSATLLKQVIVALVRRSLRSLDDWVERFSLLSDPQIARAFADMTAHPGAQHSVQSLARAAFLSRSAFMARFTSAVGRSPMTVLRELRMRQAAEQLTSSALTVDEIIRQAGYASRSSFVRAFRKAYGVDPSSYRQANVRSATIER
jgi:AraC family transcriptional activator of mtrCDE